MAYMRELKVLCNRCEKKRATHEIFNRYNSSYGKYCKPCANTMLKIIDMNEATSEKAIGNMQGGAYGKG